jgi:bla regulator protein blaR1
LEEIPASELESILLHELGHYSRGDLVWEWLFAIARCVHWMNPAVWLAERLARRERELACDAWALERTACPGQYGEALVEALRRGAALPKGKFRRGGDGRRCPADCATFGMD